MSTKLFPFQQRGVNLLDAYNGRALLADEQGLGKTIISLKYLQNHPEIRPAVIVCPASVKYVWEDQAKLHCNLRTLVCSGRKTPKDGLRNKDSIFVINYDILSYWTTWLRDIHPQIVIFDECSRLKSRGAKRTKAARLLCSPIKRVAVKDLDMFGKNKLVIIKHNKVKGIISSINQDKIATVKTQIPHLIGLSGTPLTNRPSELWSILNLIWPVEFPAFTPYAWDYCSPQITPYGWKYTGATNLNKLHAILKDLGMIRRLKKDVLKELPDKIIQVIPLEMNNIQVYKKVLGDFINWLSRIDKEKARRASKAEKITQLAYLRRTAAEGKLNNLYDWIDSFLEESDDKLVLGCIHHSIIDAIYNRYRNISLTLTGKTPPHKRRSTVQMFRTSRNKRIFIGQIYAMGLGLDGLQHVSHTSGIVEIPWDPGTLSQFMDRIHRIGQTKGVSINFFVARGSIEEKLCDIIQTKQKVLNKILDGKASVASTNIDIFDQLTEMIEGK